MLTLADHVRALVAAARLDDDRAASLRWAMAFWASMAVGVLLKGLIAAVFPGGRGLALSGDHRPTDTGAKPGRDCASFPGLLLFLAIAAPWHVIATLRNPPYFDFTMHSESGSYHGFFWFYFFNEHILRFLNRRYPRDYNTVPRRCSGYST